MEAFWLANWRRRCWHPTEQSCLST